MTHREWMDFATGVEAVVAARGECGDDDAYDALLARINRTLTPGQLEELSLILTHASDLLREERRDE
jgi:hypothetical protein